MSFEPSFSRRATIAAAAARPVTTPLPLAWPSGRPRARMILKKQRDYADISRFELVGA
jgi:hypothetical protein